MRKYLVLLVIGIVASFGINTATSSAAINCSVAVGQPFTSGTTAAAGIQAWCHGTVTKAQFNGTVNASYFYNNASGGSASMNYPYGNQVVYLTFPQPGDYSTLSLTGNTINCHSYDGWMQTYTFNTYAIFQVRFYNYPAGTWGPWHNYGGPLGWWC